MVNEPQTEKATSTSPHLRHRSAILACRLCRIVYYSSPSAYEFTILDLFCQGTVLKSRIVFRLPHWCCPTGQIVCISGVSLAEVRRLKIAVCQKFLVAFLVITAGFLQQFHQCNALFAQIVHHHIRSNLAFMEYNGPIQKRFDLVHIMAGH